MSWQDHSKTMEDKMMQAVVEMRKFGILDQGNNKEFDGQPIVSEDLVGKFINALSYEQQHELQWRWLRNESVEAKYRDDMECNRSFFLYQLWQSMYRLTYRQP